MHLVDGSSTACRVAPAMPAASKSTELEIANADGGLVSTYPLHLVVGIDERLLARQRAALKRTCTDCLVAGSVPPCSVTSVGNSRRHARCYHDSARRQPPWRVHDCGDTAATLPGLRLVPAQRIVSCLNIGRVERAVVRRGDDEGVVADLR